MKNRVGPTRISLGLVIGLILCITAVSKTQAEEKSDKVFVELQSYGEFSHRDTNFSRDDYSAVAGWAEFRAVLRYKGNLKSATSKRLLFEPYIKGTLGASENSFFWENNIVYGVGLENRFLESFVPEAAAGLMGLARGLRLYVEYQKISYTKDDAENGIPGHDMRFGVDLWKEWNIPPNSKLSNIWGELWGNAGWRETNYSSSDYKTYSCGAMGRFGVKSFKPMIYSSNITADLLPYFMVETSITGKNNFWENGLFAGAGIRLMTSLKLGSNKARPLIIKVFTEWFANVDYYKGTPTSETPDHDVRVGVNFSYNLY